MGSLEMLASLWTISKNGGSELSYSVKVAQNQMSR